MTNIDRLYIFRHTTADGRQVEVFASSRKQAEQRILQILGRKSLPGELENVTPEYRKRLEALLPTPGKEPDDRRSAVAELLNRMEE